MLTINSKGKANLKDQKMVKFEMIIFKTGYIPVGKVLSLMAIEAAKKNNLYTHQAEIMILECDIDNFAFYYHLPHIELST